MASVPPAEHSIAMTLIVEKKNYITTAQAKQQSISHIIMFVIDKSLILFTQLLDAQVVIGPLIAKINPMDITYPEVTKLEANFVVHTT